MGMVSGILPVVGVPFLHEPRAVPPGHLFWDLACSVHPHPPTLVQNEPWSLLNPPRKAGAHGVTGTATPAAFRGNLPSNAPLPKLGGASVLSTAVRNAERNAKPQVVLKARRRFLQG